MNKELNKFRMTTETRNKLRAAHLNTGKTSSYEKTFGVHTHRVVAEWALGRKLKPGEVVHHIDGDRRNNNPENILVFASQKEHAKLHAELAGRKEVVPHEVHTT
ncbi:HNH endonuclease signature motif containing protein [Anaerotignum sp.]|uniref:HNH endonuclease signature motif containing protein n=1 Tax=Anaerotignum sp. TaxID=2039241 RepID=UPI0033329DB9